MGWLEAIGSMFSWLSGGGIAASFARVAVAFGLMRWLSGTQQQPSTATTAPNNRIQVPPATSNKIPVAYGKSYFNGTIFDVQLTNSNKSLYAAIVLCETTGNLFSTGSASSITIDAIYLDNKLITFKSDGTTVDYVTDDTGVQDTNPSGLMSIALYQGSSNNPMLPCQANTTTPISGTVPSAAYNVMPGWNNTYTASNLVFAIVKLNYDQSKGQHSIPNLKFHVCNTMTKPGDVLYDYMTNGLYGANIDSGLINSASITALNSYSSESVTYSPYPAQPRYTINGIVNTSQKVLNNMDIIAAAAASYITYDISSGQWAVLIQRVISQSFSFNDSNILGQINATGTALDSYYNSVEMQFPYAYLRDQANFVRVDLPSADLDFNEPVNILKIQNDLINNVVQATIISNIQLRQSREDLVVVFKTDFSSYNLQVGDVIGITNSTYGFSNRQFRVIKLIKVESDAGELTIEVTGLSYNPSVYTVDNISQFIPLLGAGHSIPALSAIGTPIKPTVTSSTISSQPSITITATIPSGVVTDMEFWASSDGTNYVFQGTMRNPNSGPFTTGTTTSFKTIELQTATWYFKVRAANVQGTSAFSPASDGLAYTYTQAPDILPYTTPITNSPGGGLGTAGNLALGALAFYVAGKLDWGGIFSTATDELASIFGISPDTVASIKSSVSSQVTGGISTDPGSGIIVSGSGKVSLDPTVVSALSTTPCSLTITPFYPADRSTHENPERNTSGDRATHTGPYSITCTPSPGTALTAGTGSIKLYKSNGTLVQTVAASAMTISGYGATIPFNDREIGVDYYITLDKNVLTDGTCKSDAILDPYSWNFHTADPQDAIAPHTYPQTSVRQPVCPPVKFLKLKTYLFSYYKLATATSPLYTGQVKQTNDNTKVDPESNIGLEFNQTILLQTTGTITINSSSGVFQTFNLSQTFDTNKIGELFWIEGDTLWLNPTKDMIAGTTYWVTMTSNCVRNKCNTGGNTQIADSTTATWTIDNGTIFNG